MKTSAAADFDQRYQSHLKHLKLKGLQPKTIDAYSRAIRRMGEYFERRIDNLTEAQLTDYFTDLIASHSWSAVKLDLYGYKFYTLHVLRRPWTMPQLIKPPKVQRLPAGATPALAVQLLRPSDGDRTAADTCPCGDCTADRQRGHRQQVGLARLSSSTPSGVMDAFGQKLPNRLPGRCNDGLTRR